MKIEVTIMPDGTVSGDVTGGPGGPTCLNKLDELLGDLGESSSPQKKREFYQHSNAKEKGRVRQ